MGKIKRFILNGLMSEGIPKHQAKVAVRILMKDAESRTFWKSWYHNRPNL